MKKSYVKPTLLRRETLSKVTAGNGSLVLPDNGGAVAAKTILTVGSTSRSNAQLAFAVALQTKNPGARPGL